MTMFMSTWARLSWAYSRSRVHTSSMTPADTAATCRMIGESTSLPSAISLSTAMHSATNAPVMDAVRVPPSAWMTSQSM